MLSAPLAAVYVLLLREPAGRTSVVTVIPALKGVLAYLLVAAPLLVASRFVPRSFDGIDLYIYSSVHDFAVPGILSFFLYLWFVRGVRNLTPDERFLSFVSFLGGAFTLAGLVDLAVRGDYLGPYELFHLPALRIALMLILPSLLYRFSSGTSASRYLYVLAVFLVPFILGAVPLLAGSHYTTASWVVAAALFVASWAMALLVTGNAARSRCR
jgi:hypothetical protein